MNLGHFEVLKLYDNINLRYSLVRKEYEINFTSPFIFIPIIIEILKACYYIAVIFGIYKFYLLFKDYFDYIKRNNERDINNLILKANKKS